jgi:hypothetical protein
MKISGRIRLLLLLPFLSLLTTIGFSQDSLSLNAGNEKMNRKELFGFIRGGLFTGIDHNDNHIPYVSSAFADFCLRVELENGMNFKAFADLRFRYGAEFLEPVNRFDIREAYVRVNGKRWDVTAGQKIVKWGRADFTNPTSKLNPQNLISRSPDREDMDMGNLLSTFKWYPSDHINLEAVVVPFYSSSVLIIDPVPLPENVTIKQINSLVTKKEMFSYGIKADINLSGIDWSISWFDGYDPMPGIALTDFNFDLTAQVPVTTTALTITPFKTRVLGLDFEAAAGKIGIRGEAALSVPYLSFKTLEYVPCTEIKWVTGVDWSSGIWRITAEYSGKNIPDFIPVSVDPLIGTEPDYSKLAGLLAIPGFNPEDYVRQQVGAFNRLYNYQLERYYHSAAFRIESDLIYGKLMPSVFTMYNITSHDLLIIPEIKYKPADGLTITAGAEFYSGRNGSLYDIVNGFMNSFYIALKADF